MPHERQFIPGPDTLRQRFEESAFLELLVEDLASRGYAITINQAGKVKYREPWVVISASEQGTNIFRDILETAEFNALYTATIGQYSTMREYERRTNSSLGKVKDIIADTNWSPQDKKEVEALFDFRSLLRSFIIENTEEEVVRVVQGQFGVDPRGVEAHLLPILTHRLVDGVIDRTRQAKVVV